MTLTLMLNAASLSKTATKETVSFIVNLYHKLAVNRKGKISSSR
jgi:hypothetical protein